MELGDRLAIVTGAGSGAEAVIAQHLGSLGARLLIDLASCTGNAEPAGAWCFSP
jgi:hypothetical protein